MKVSPAGTDTVTFKYDPFGRRIEKSVATIEDGLPTTYKYTYVYDNEDIILEVFERTQDGVTTTTTTSYVHGPGIDEPLSFTREGQTYYYHADGLGSITAVTDANGAVVNRYAYDSFGRIQKSETVRNAYAFTGREYDSETGLYYLRARYYDPEAGRFVSKDPIGFAGGDVNLYNYTSGNPVNWVDPYGLYSFDEFLIDASNFSAGMGDTITGGGTKWIREQMNEAYGWGDDIVDSKCSKAYTAGVAAGYGWDVAFMLAGGGSLKGYEASFRYYKNAKGVGVNLLKRGKRVFSADWHKVTLKGRPMYRPHYHRRFDGPGGGIGRHRPWEGW